MHIAICDDNVADRKQLERLLKRESDRRFSDTGILYTDSFGNASLLLANPMQYNLFYIDICQTEGTNGIEVTNALLAKGVQAPIVLCCSSIDYSRYSFPDTVFFLQKPLQLSQLRASLDHALQLRERTEALIELRENTKTLYVTEPDILYAVESGSLLTVTLSDGRKITLATSARNFFSQIEQHPTFFAPGFKIILNGRYLKKLKFRKAIMTDGASFPIHKDCMAYAKQLLAEFSNPS